MKVFLVGDVMTGRGIDQILRHPADPSIHESYMTSAVDYVLLAEDVTGPIPRSVDPAYIWGDALRVLAHESPDFRIINLETAVTKNEEWLPKGINYRMHPANVDCLTAAQIDCCVLANNHVLDWGAAGLIETLEALERVGIRTVGAGRNEEEAQTPAILESRSGSRAIVFAYAMESSGVPEEWMATARTPGVNFLPDLSMRQVHRISAEVPRVKRPGDLVIVSIHWGGNWDYGIDHDAVLFAHELIDAGVDVLYGHSSHHPKGIQIYRDRPVIYGCGDFINDYEGITGYEEFRSDLGLMYFVSIHGEGIAKLRVVPTQMRHFRVNRASRADAQWLETRLTREGKRFGVCAELQLDGSIEVRSSRGAAKAG